VLTLRWTGKNHQRHIRDLAIRTCCVKGRKEHSVDTILSDPNKGLTLAKGPTTPILSGPPSALDYVTLPRLLYPLRPLEGLFYLSFCSLLPASINKMICEEFVLHHGSHKKRGNTSLGCQMTSTCSCFLSCAITSASLLPGSSAMMRRTFHPNNPKCHCVSGPCSSYEILNNEKAGISKNWICFRLHVRGGRHLLCCVL
jgi:hypothetical protein